MTGHFRQRARCALGVSAALALALTLGGCVDFRGPLPQDESLHFPVGLVVHPSGDVLYAVNSNFDSTYRSDLGGQVVAVDLDTLEVIDGSGVLIASFGGRAALSPSEDRLYVAVRGDDSLVTLDVSEDGRSLSCDGDDVATRCRVRRSLPEDVFGLDVVRVDQGESRTEMVAVSGLSSPRFSVASMTLPAETFDEEMSARRFAREAEVATLTMRNARFGGRAVRRDPGGLAWYIGGRFSGAMEVAQASLGCAAGESEGCDGRVNSLSTLGTILFDGGERAPDGVRYDIHDVAFSADSRRIFAAARAPSSVLVSTRTATTAQREIGTWTARVDVDGPPSEIASVTEGGREKLYVSLTARGELVVIDAETLLIEDTIEVGDSPFSIAVDDEVRRRLYVSLFAESSIAVVDIDPTSPRFRRVIARIQ